jgi:hypothetical protein
MKKGFAIFTLYENAEVCTQHETRQDNQVHFKQPPKWNKVLFSEKMKKGFSRFTLYEYAEVYTQYETQDYQVHFKQPP